MFQTVVEFRDDLVGNVETFDSKRLVESRDEYQDRVMDGAWKVCVGYDSPNDDVSATVSTSLRVSHNSPLCELITPQRPGELA